jgi:hypothetical protein
LRSLNLHHIAKAGLSRNKRHHEKACAAAVEVLGFPPLHLKMEAEAQAGICRLSCNDQWKPRSIYHGHERKVQDITKEPSIQRGLTN